MEKVTKPVTKPTPKPQTPKSPPVTKGWLQRQLADPFLGLRRVCYYLWTGQTVIPNDQWLSVGVSAYRTVADVEEASRHGRLIRIGEDRWLADASSCVVTHAWVSGDRVVEARERRIAEMAVRPQTKPALRFARH